MPSKPRRTGRRTVCLLSPHLFVLRELAALLEGHRYRLQLRRLEPALVPEVRRIPPASLYVVDAMLPQPVPEVIIASIADRFPTARLLVLAERFSEANAFPLLRLGVKGLVRYGEIREQLPQALEAVIGGGVWAPRSLLSHFMDSMLSRLRGRGLPSVAAPMSHREREVLRSVLENLSNKEIAAKLHISERTVKFHVSNLLAKFRVSRRQELILRCLSLRATAS